jgi:hypothetical protein
MDGLGCVTGREGGTEGSPPVCWNLCLTVIRIPLSLISFSRLIDCLEYSFVGNPSEKTDNKKLLHSVFRVLYTLSLFLSRHRE